MSSDTEGKGDRLHKVLAHAGIASRRKCEDLIREGRVKVNGRIVTEMGVRVDPDTDDVQVDGESVKPEAKVYLLVYKPKDYLCTTSDQFGRKTILDLVPAHRRSRLFTVGRLEYDAEGLVIVTNDGEFANEVLHPRRRLARTYWLKVRGQINPELVKRAREGVWLSDGRTPPMDVFIQRAGREISTAKCTLVERHHHQLKRIWARLGTPVMRLVLVKIASIGTEELKKGHVRPLTPAEVDDLRNGPPAPDALVVSKNRRKAAAPPKTGPTSWGVPASSFDSVEGEGVGERREHSERPPKPRKAGAARGRPDQRPAGGGRFPGGSRFGRPHPRSGDGSGGRRHARTAESRGPRGFGPKRPNEAGQGVPGARAARTGGGGGPRGAAGPGGGPRGFGRKGPPGPGGPGPGASRFPRPRPGAGGGPPQRGTGRPSRPSSSGRTFRKRGR